MSTSTRARPGANARRASYQEVRETLEKLERRVRELEQERRRPAPLDQDKRAGWQ